MIEGNRPGIPNRYACLAQRIWDNRMLIAYTALTGSAALAIAPSQKHSSTADLPGVQTSETTINSDNQLGSCRTSKGKTVFVGQTSGTDTCLNFQDVDDESGQPHLRYSTFSYQGTEMCTVYNFKTGESTLITFGNPCNNPINDGE